jgi:hypothetical protein
MKTSRPLSKAMYKMLVMMLAILCAMVPLASCNRPAEPALLDRQYTGVYSAVVINEEYILGRNISAEQSDMANEIQQNRNENLIHGIKQQGIESGVKITFLFAKAQADEPYVKDSTVVHITMGSVRLLPGLFATYKDGREGDATITVDGDSFSLVKVETEDKDWVAPGAIYKVEGSFTAEQIEGTWSVEEGGQVMFQGVFEADAR